MKRLRYAYETPLAIETHYYPVYIGMKLSELDIATEALYDLHENKLHIQLSDAEQIITSNTLNSEDA
ncbi:MULTISPECIES: UTRA domain-containing protein [unclassified Sporosarcina]|uniref:UTRA domain-containing protein n=1 Tax=unclassified Sporosarcina TaxID=2647733 RepID=UPI001E5B52CA|nr:MULTISPECIES: UTRA domain-containing protein [unclassified Sporosarcina]